MQKAKTLKEHVTDIKAEGTRCNCDLDNWEPEPDTGHSWVCRIHRIARMRMTGEYVVGS